MIESMRCRGMRDTLPEEMQRFRRVEQAFREVCHGWRYREVRTPAIEHLHLFTAAGTLSPQLLGRVYSFLDWDGWSGERVVLRPDSTIPTARLYLESLRDEGIARLFYVQNVFRFAQGEESREDWQLGVELIGDTQPAGDIELILMGCETLERLGLEPQLRLSDPGILRAVLARAGFGREEQITLYDRILDGDAGALEEVAARLPDAGATARALLSAEGEGLAYLSNLRSALEPSIPEIARPLDELTAVAGALAETGRAFRISPALVRNFEYYTGPFCQFEVAGQTVGRGGRYDGLLSLLGDSPVPASGFALWAGTLQALLPEPDAAEAPQVALRPASDARADLGATFRLAAALRQAGWAVSVAGGEDADRRVTAGAAGFLLEPAGDGGQRLATVEAVVKALAEAARD